MNERPKGNVGLDAAIEAAGGSASNLARMLRITRQAVSQWRRSGIPARRAIEIERKTGIPVRVLRPDVWREHRAAP